MKRAGVYMISCPPNAVKIGVAINPRVRCADLQIGNPNRLKVEWFHWFGEYAHGVEAHWHRYFKSQNIRGEWFALDREDISYVKRRSDISLLQELERTR